MNKDGVIRRKRELLTEKYDRLTSYRQRTAVIILAKITEEVAAAVKICNGYQTLWVTRGTGTGLSGGAALPIREYVLIVTTRMKKILEIDLKN